MECKRREDIGPTLTSCVWSNISSRAISPDLHVFGAISPAGHVNVFHEGTYIAPMAESPAFPGILIRDGRNLPIQPFMLVHLLAPNVFRSSAPHPFQQAHTWMQHPDLPIPPSPGAAFEWVPEVGTRTRGW